MNNQKFKKHAIALFTLFLSCFIALIIGNDPVRNVVYYILPVGAIYALYIGIANTLYNKKTGNLLNNKFNESSTFKTLIFAIGYGAVLFLLILLIDLKFDSEFSFEQSMKDHFLISMASGLFVIFATKYTNKFLAGRKEGSF